MTELDPEALTLLDGRPAASVTDVLAALDALDIFHQTHQHAPQWTVEDAKTIQTQSVGAHIKNLFLRNKKGRMWVVVLEQDCQIDLRRLRQQLGGSGGQVSFASVDRMTRHLGVIPGAVTPLAAINDHAGLVEVVMDATLLKSEWIHVHPCRNTYTTRLRVEDLLRALNAWQHPVRVLDFAPSADAL